MSLTRVGAHDPAGPFISTGLTTGSTFSISFLPDTVWSAGDVIACWVSAADSFPGSGFSYASMLTATSGWNLDGSIEQNTFEGYWWLVTHEVTPGEAGAGAITVTFTLQHGSGSAYAMHGGGVGVRGGDYSTRQVFSDDDTGQLSVSSTSGVTETYADVVPYATGSAGTLLMSIHGALNATALTAASNAWSATELMDVFQANALGTNDAAISSAYRLTTTEDWPADTLVYTFTGTGAGGSAWRYAIVMDAGSATLAVTHSSDAYIVPDPSGSDQEEGGTLGFQEFWDVFDGTEADAANPVVDLAFPDLDDVQDTIDTGASSGTLVVWDGTSWVGVTVLDGGSP